MSGTNNTPAGGEPHAWRTLLLVVLVVFGLPAAFRLNVPPIVEQAGYGDGSKPAGAPAFDSAPLEALRRQRPRYVFIGNSNAYTRIDEARLERRLGAEVLVQATAATAGPHWYLQVKNHVIASGVKPHRVFILFRDGELLDYTSAKAELRLRYSQDLEPAFADIDRAECTTLGMRLRAGTRRAVAYVWPLSTVPRDDLYTVTDALTPSDLLDGRSPREFHRVLNRRFGLGHLRTDAHDALIDSASGRADPEAFAARAACSTLPHLLAAARETELSLVFLRIQRRTWSADDADVEREARELAAYLRARGAAFHDFSGDPAIRPEWYGAIDHIADEYRGVWTDLLVERLAPLFRGADR